MFLVSSEILEFIALYNAPANYKENYLNNVKVNNNFQLTT